MSARGIVRAIVHAPRLAWCLLVAIWYALRWGIDDWFDGPEDCGLD